MDRRFGWGLVSVVLVISVALARSPALRPPGKPGSAYLLLFDPASIGTVEGTIVRIHQVPAPKVWLTSVHALLRTRNGTMSVDLGPAWFIDNQELHLAVDDLISVTGSLVKTKGVDSMIAVEVRRGEEFLRLRGTDGMPVWVAWRWRTPEGASR